MTVGIVKSLTQLQRRCQALARTDQKLSLPVVKVGKLYSAELGGDVATMAANAEQMALVDEEAVLQLERAIHEAVLQARLKKLPKGVINQVIDRMQSDQKSLWDRKDVKSALKDFPDQVSQVEFFDLGQLLKMLKPMMGEMMEEEVEDLDLKAEDLPDFPYFMLGWAKYVKRGLVSKVTLFPSSSK